MITHIVLLAASIVVAQTSESPALDVGPAPESAAATVPEVFSERPYRVSLALGEDRPTAASAKRLGGFGEPVTRLQVERDLFFWLEGLSANIGVSYLARGGDDRLLTAAAGELQIGVTYGWPAHGWRGFLFPYARLSLLAGYVHVGAPADLGADALVPGIYGGLGLRAHLGRATAATPQKVYIFAEGGFAGRYSTAVSLHRSSAVDNPLPAQNTPIGRLSLSGWDWCVGLGLTL